MANIKKGDLVQVITGRTQVRGGSRGKQGRVIEVFAEKNRVIVEGDLIHDEAGAAFLAYWRERLS